MKNFLCCLLVATLLLLCGCDAAPKDVTIDSTYVIVAAEDATPAARSLQITLAQHTDVDVELVTEAAEGTKSITVAVNDSLDPGEYRTSITKDGLVIEAKDSYTLFMAMRTIRQRFIQEKAIALPITTFDCKNLSGTIEYDTAPFLVLSQNIRYADDEGGNMVIQRAPRFNQLVQEYLPDIMCIQEDNRTWAPIMDKFFGENYSMVGEYSGGPDTTKGNRQSIYFRSDRYELLENGALWLSDTPFDPMTKFEDSKSVRHTTWAVLKDKHTNCELFVCDIHLDNTTNEVRLAQLDVLYTHLGSYMETYPTIMCGDFNARPDSGVYEEVTKTFLDPHVTASAKPDFTEYSFTRYGTAQFGTNDETRRLDYMFYNDQLVANMYRIMTDTYDGYISDHFGVMTEYSFAE